jgi:sulfite exporter TauE/SafE
MTVPAASDMAAQLAAAAAAGLLSGFSHCLGMCGPLVASFGLSAGSGTAAPASSRRGSSPGSSGAGPVLRAAAAQLPYHLGRVTTYAAIGAVMGATGAFVNVAGRLAGLSDAVAVLAGALMVALGLGAAGVSGVLRRFEARTSGGVVAAARRMAGGGATLYPLGLLLGLLPCGVSWTIFLAAAAAGGPVPGLLLALAFGLGTVPGLLLVGALSALLGQRARGWLARASGLAVAFLGLLFLLRGLGLHAPL